MDDEYPGYGARHRLACDFCRLIKKACTRPSPGEVCFQCRKSRSPCSPGRTLEELRRILYGRNGVLLHPRFRTGFGGQQAGATPPQQLPPSPFRADPNVGADRTFQDGDDVFNVHYSPSGAFSRGETPLLGSEVFSPAESRLSADFSVASVVPLPIPASIPASTAAPSLNHERELFNEYGALQIISKYIDRHLSHVDRHLLRTSRTMKALIDCNEVVERRMKLILDKIVRAAYEADDRNEIDKATWIYQLLSHELDMLDMPEDRKRSLLLKISRFYQRTDFHVQSKNTLERVALMRRESGYPLEKQECQLHTEFLEKTSMTTTNAYQNLPQHEVPTELHKEPCPTIHRALQHDTSLLHTTSFLAAMAQSAPTDIVGQSVLHAAALIGDPSLIERLHHAFPAIEIDTRDSCRRTALSVAATSGHLEACQTLLSRGANKNARNIAGHSIIELASRCGHLPIVELLCNCNVDIEPTQLEGTSTALQAAAEAGHIEVVGYLLSIGRADPTFKRSHDQLTAEEIARDLGHNDIGDLIQNWDRLPGDSMCDIYSPPISCT